MPALKPPPRHPSSTFHVGKIECPRCRGNCLDRETLRCICSAEFTAEGLAHFQSLPTLTRPDRPH